MDAQTTVGAGLDAGASRRARAMAASLDKPPAAAVGPWVACGSVVNEQPARRKHAKSRLVSEPARPRAVGSVQPLVPSPDLTRLSIVLRPGVSSVVVDSGHGVKGGTLNGRLGFRLRERVSLRQYGRVSPPSRSASLQLWLCGSDSARCLAFALSRRA